MPPFDTVGYKEATRAQWNESGGGYAAWGDQIAALSRPAVDRMCERAGISTGKRVLELAAGAGAQTVMLAERVGPEGSVLATDLAPGILSHARALIEARGITNVQLKELDGECVDVGDDRFDAVVSSLGLMFFPNVVTSLVAQCRACGPGGRVGAVVISTPDKNPFFSVPAGVIRRRAGLGMPDPTMPGPFALGPPGLLEKLFEEAGLVDVTSERIPSALELDSVDEVLRLLSDAFAALHLMMRGMSASEVEDTWRAVGDALAPFDKDGGFKSPAELVVVVGSVAPGRA